MNDEQRAKWEEFLHRKTPEITDDETPVRYFETYTPSLPSASEPTPEDEPELEPMDETEPETETCAITGITFSVGSASAEELCATLAKYLDGRSVTEAMINLRFV